MPEAQAAGQAAENIPDRAPSRPGQKVKESLGIVNDLDAAVVAEKDTRIRCPECGSATVNAQEDHTTCLNCGYTSGDSADFIEPHVVYVKVVPDEDFRLSRKQIRYQTRCPNCGSRDVEFLFGKGMARCNNCLNEGTVQQFYAEKAHPHPGADDGDI